MYKVLIVDDESIIRKGLTNVINWKNLDCMVCGEASDGIEGMNKIEEFKPDLIITDINMPGVDGLNMIKRTKELISDSKIIILTGYRNLEYLQDAIKIGAFDYILKPSQIEVITSTIKRAVKELDFTRHSEAEIIKLKEYFESKLPLLKEKLLYDLMFDLNIKKDEIVEDLNFYKISMNNFIVMAVETELALEAGKDIDTNEEAKNQNGSQLYQFGIINTFESIFSEYFIVESVTLNSKQIIFVVQPKGISNDNLVAKASEVAGNFQNLIKNCFNFTISIGISDAGNSPFELSERTKEALGALNYKFYLGSNSIIPFEDLKYFYKSVDFTLLENYEKMLIQNIKIGDENSTRVILKDIFQYVNECAIEKDIIKNFYFNIINLITNMSLSYEAPEGAEVGQPKIQYIFELFHKCNSLIEMNTLLEKIAIITTSKIHSYNEKSINTILQKAIDYINNNYQNALTLNGVAAYVYVSTYYLSRMFTKELDKNFVDYLSEIRVEKAKEFLKSSSYKTYEIAELVGIKDSHYFSKIFKKYTGHTPSEYRAQKLPG